MQHLFRIETGDQRLPDAIVADIPVDGIKAVLEYGPRGDGHGYGPVQIESIEFAPPPSRLIRLPEAQEVIEPGLQKGD